MNWLVCTSDRGVPLYGPSGASVHLRQIARALVRAGHRVGVATHHDHDHRGRHDAPIAGIEAIHLGTGPWRAGWRRVGAAVDGIRLRRRARRWGPADRIWERHGPPPGISIRGVRRIVELNAPWRLEQQRLHNARPSPRDEAREARQLRSADRVVAVSAWLARWAVEAIGCDPDRVRHVPNGVAPQQPEDPHRVRRSLGISGPVVGFVGSFKPWHGVDRLAAILDALGPRWTGIAVGVGPIAVAHPRLVCPGRIPTDQLPAWVAAFDVGIAPYRSDAPPWFCPLKILDYRAQGVPVVAADVGDCAALVGHGGEIVASDDPTAWGDAIRRQALQRYAPSVRTWDRVLREALAPAPGGSSP